MSAEREAGRVVCLGEALVDLVCERPVAGLADAEAFVPRVGGSLTNIAVVASRFGARTQLLGGAGEDEWGRWLRDRIEGEGVDVSRLRLVPGTETSLAFVTVSEGGEPSFAFHACGERAPARAGADLEPALGGRAGVLALGSDTLLADGERAVTMRAAELGAERGWTVLCDPNLRPNRWADRASMLEGVRPLVARAAAVKCNAAEARALTGLEDERDAAGALLGLGPSVAVLTRGPRGALVAATGLDEPLQVDAPPAEVVDATGAGDCVTGVLAAALAAGAGPESLGAAVAVAMRAAAGVVARWGALSGLPAPGEARAAMAEALAAG